MELFCYIVYSECIVLVSVKSVFKLYFHMFSWGQSMFSLKVTGVLCFQTEGKLMNQKLLSKLLINVNQSKNKLPLTENKYSRLIIFSLCFQR